MGWSGKIHLLADSLQAECGRNPVGLLFLRAGAKITPAWPGKDMCSECVEQAKRRVCSCGLEYEKVLAERNGTEYLHSVCRPCHTARGEARRRKREEKAIAQ